MVVQIDVTDPRASRGILDNATTIIAVVDDDPGMLRGIVRLLGAHGFGTRAFASAEAFLDDAEARSAACLILDIRLGGISGIELRRQLTASGARVPVIFITAVDDEVTRAEAMAAGCIAYLRKPFPAAQLIDAIDKAPADRSR
jgi:FixJ family two-component response regulator